MPAPSKSEIGTAAGAAYQISTGNIDALTALPGLTLLKTSGDLGFNLGDGFAAAAFRDSQGNIILAFEGTVPGFSTYDKATLSADGMLAQGLAPQALEKRGHVWTAPCLQGFSGGGISVACSHVSGLLVRCA